MRVDEVLRPATRGLLLLRGLDAARHKHLGDLERLADVSCQTARCPIHLPLLLEKSLVGGADVTDWGAGRGLAWALGSTHQWSKGLLS